LAHLEQNVPSSTLNTMICRKYSFQKLTEFLQGSYVQDASAPNIDGFLWIDTRVSSTQVNRPLGSKQSLSGP
jgi:hypothetical protein